VDLTPREGGTNLLGRQALRRAVHHVHEEQVAVGREQILQRAPDCAVDELGAPQNLDPILLHAVPGEQFQRLHHQGVIASHSNRAEQLLVDGDRGVCVVDPPLISVGENDPLDASHQGVAHDLVRPPAVVEVRAQGLRLDKQPRRAQDEQAVVDGLVPPLQAELALDLLDILDVPPERAEHGLDEGRLRVLLVQAPLGAPGHGRCRVSRAPGRDPDVLSPDCLTISWRRSGGDDQGADCRPRAGGQNSGAGFATSSRLSSGCPAADHLDTTGTPPSFCLPE